MPNYDYIIIGAGASGLLLASAFGKDDFFSSKSILIIDKDDKTKNDRTWCFWEKGSGKFDELIYRKWPNIFFAGKKLALSTPLHPYCYKMLRGIDFYNQYISEVKNSANVTWLHDKVIDIQDNENDVTVVTETESHTGGKVFNSLFDYKQAKNQKKYPVLQQHFVGWFVKTEKPVFKPDEATFMDFSIPQKGNTRFMYVLPFSENQALLEYTLFSNTTLERSEYEKGIIDYLENKLECSNYTILEKESGNIPMTCYEFHQHNSNRILHIGIAGGWAKPSTGFTFYNTNKKVDALIGHLKKKKPLKQFAKKDKFWFYDLLLLDILYKKNHLGQPIFESLFKRRKASLILKFLDNETSLWEDIKIMSAPKPFPFIKALLSRIF
ncbi:lycopene cyclase [Flagellimonas sp. HMM57]|uniref:lycopene cyclase family protein n=1 Tax=unclassified Flagellimonas TaxID=2644544 RepID=UPI0013D56043|nr:MULTISPECIES: lycopene cyclase family protein [unclassified Flagellimonas]UII77407.1 lycopene cyclase [Flagellimonas sp. HMM57]